ncbi:MAG: putative toxin-antitoxin system toxin component, PIN family [Bacteroidales bacterium]|nr:putative toxin-antitoxin system toxin component, PIN family [Bacteroidales bacterium]
MFSQKIRIIFDTNIWISFSIGKRLDVLKDVLLSGRFDILICEEIITEYLTVIQREELAKFVPPARSADTIDLIETFATKRKIKSKVKLSRDPNDDFLLAFAIDTNADYLVTGDKDLLAIKKYKNTLIVDFSTFLDSNF